MKTPTLYFLIQPELAGCHDDVGKTLGVAGEENLWQSVRKAMSQQYDVHNILQHTALANRSRDKL